MALVRIASAIRSLLGYAPSKSTVLEANVLKSYSLVRANRTAGVTAGLLGLTAVLALTGVARAQEHREERREEHRDERREDRRGHEEMHHGYVARERFAFRERDVHRFNEIELGRWRGGQWRNSCFAGRCGWWWFAGGQWFFYERPVYPYPLIVSEVAYEEGVAPVYAPPPGTYAVPPPGYAVPPAGYAVPPSQPAPAPQVYYYCDNPAGYYPTVPSCPAGFRAVPAPR